MKLFLRKILSLPLLRRSVPFFIRKPGKPLYLAVVIHTEKIQDPDIVKQMLELGKNLPFRPSACVMTPANPYIRADMERRQVGGETFLANLKDLSRLFEIGLHGHYCRPLKNNSPDPAAGTEIERAGFELTLNDPAEIKRQFQAEYDYLSANLTAPKAYSAGWWVLNDTITAMLKDNCFDTDCSIRHGYRDTFGGEYLPPKRLPEKGVPFVLPPTTAVVELPSVFYLHMNWWTLIKELFPLLTNSRGPMFAVLPTHDYNLKEDLDKVLDNIRLLTNIKNVRFVSLSEMKKLAESSGAVFGAPGFTEKPCPLCGQALSGTVWQEGTHKAVECRDCGLIRVDPQPPGLKDIYSEAYYRNNYLPQAEIRMSFFTKRLAEIEKLRPAKGKVLDVGCGLGFFLKSAKKTGWQTAGLEPSEFAADYARNEFGLDVTAGALKKDTFPGNNFDLVTLWDVIAHLTDPAGYLRELNHLLKKDGLLVVATPVRPKPVFKFASLISRFITSSYYLHIPQQLFHFTPETLEKMLIRQGFRPIRSEFISLPLTTSVFPVFKGGLKDIAAKFLHLMADRFHYHDYLLVYAGKERDL